MTVLLILFVIILALLIILALPVTFWGRVRLNEKLAGEGELAWAGGLVAARLGMLDNKPAFSLRVGRWTGRPPRSGRKKPARPKQEKKRKPDQTRNAFRIKRLAPFLDGPLLKRAFAYLRRIWRSLDLKLRLEGEYGTGDPALTGYLTSLVSALHDSRLELHLRPNFAETALDLRGEVGGRLVPVRFLWLTGGFLLAAPVRRLWWSRIIKRKTKVREVF
ncbi:DUF2953 domain-containing protein [Desulfotomaculum copahuensis]|uniref:DUF2953 domain-containing protein n=1 Tax=Desulfotomaculum copahuensis TaxID=1838280 RepID=A0A1B7LGJ1_9FIRM|nr:DUF2953 domain-containing protein [Desulfotomaculum copahuensis]OAT85221.1 hypothetical protein A6M21_06655 [Desulfotomaculum copahuensis]